MPRAFIIMLDSLGVGGAHDAQKYGDEDANTLGHIAEACYRGKANQEHVRKGPLIIPNLCRLGMSAALKISSGQSLPGCEAISPSSAYGCAEEISLGKDTQSGHWEMAGVPVLFEWGYFHENEACFPPVLLEALVKASGLPGVIGNKHASGTTILEELGDEHCKTGRPIVYTSADSVFQIAAHEERFGLEKLYQVCENARRLVDPYNIGRVIARPFLGDKGKYYRTGNRRDYATPPPAPTLLDQLVASGGTVIAIGKVADIYAHQGISKTVKATGNAMLMNAFIEEAKTAPDNSITFVNLVDFDMLYGHRRNTIGYAKALEEFDLSLVSFESLLQKDDIAIITADHGCDPTLPGSDHTRENVPFLLFGPSITATSLGKRKSFADIGQSIATHLNLKPLKYGVSVI